MRALVKTILGGALCLAVAACAQPARTAAPDAPSAAPPAVASSEPTDAASCAAAGGSWQGVGLMNTPACVIPYADAGKACTDSDQCEGACWAEVAMTPEQAGGKVTGQCQPTNMPFGCHSEVIKGVAQPGLCAD